MSQTFLFGLDQLTAIQKTRRDRQITNSKTAICNTEVARVTNDREKQK